MLIAGLNKVSLLDFPNKLSCIVFTVGCNLACPFCHNADLVTESFFDTGDKNSDDKNDCANKTLISEDEVLNFLTKRKGVLEGVCITGGEPLLHHDLADFIKKARALGYKIKLDTNGSFPDRLKKLIDDNLLDYIAMDIKNCQTKYAQTAGANVDYAKILKSADIIMQSGVDYEFRTTLVKEYHTLADIENIGQQFALVRRFYLQKFVDSGNIIKDGLTALSDEDMAAMLAAIQKHIPNAALR